MMMEIRGTGSSKFKTVGFAVTYRLTDWCFPEIDFSDLEFIWNLGIEIWDFNVVSGKTNRIYLNPL